MTMSTMAAKNQLSKVLNLPGVSAISALPWHLGTLALVLGVGLAGRFWAINFGLPAAYHMEEPQYTRAALNLACQGNLDSSLLQAHTYLFALALRIASVVPGGASCATTSAALPASYLLLGRVLSAGFATALIALIFVLGRRLYSPAVGLIAAALVAGDFLLVREAHFATPDSVAVFLLALTLLSYTRITPNNVRLRDYALAAVLTALTINARPTAALLFIPFALTHLVAHNAFRRPLWPGLRAALCSRAVALSAILVVGTSIIAFPQSLVNPRGFARYWHNFLAVGQRGGFGPVQSDTLPAPLFYVRAIAWGGGWLFVAVAAVAIAWALYRRRFADWLLLSFIVPYFAMSAISTVYFARYIIPLLPLLSLLVARCLWEVLPSVRRPLWVALATIILLAVPLAHIAQFGHLLTQTDTRAITQAWVEANIPPGSHIASEWHVPSLPGYDQTVVDFYGLSEQDLASYRRAGYQYLIVSSFISEMQMVSPADQQRKDQFYRDLANNADLLVEVKPYHGATAPPYHLDESLGPLTDLSQFDHPGPTIMIYRLR
jgi:4-amino-4-deoxy-L-arabinose transferase-like glycosyltransferase